VFGVIIAFFFTDFDPDMLTSRSVRAHISVTFNICLTFHLALYGKTYIAAAKDTWGLFKDRGIDAVVNDSLVNMGMPMSNNSRVYETDFLTLALTWGGYVVGLLCALFAFLYLHCKWLLLFRNALRL
jgi:hypothetical protein